LSRVIAVRAGAIIDAAAAQNIRLSFGLSHLDLPLKFPIARYDIVVAIKEDERRFGF
jgi:hypothetical protein